MKPILFVALIYLTFGCNLEADQSAKNDDAPTKKLHHLVAFQWKEGSPLDSIIESAYNTLGKIDVYAGAFSFGNNTVSIGDTIFSTKNTQILHVIFKNEYDRDSVYIPSDLQMEFAKKWWKYNQNLYVYDWWQ